MEVCFLLPHEVQTGGTLFAAGCPDFLYWFVSEDKQYTTEEDGAMHACGCVHTHTHTPAQPTPHALRSLPSPNGLFIKAGCTLTGHSSQSPVKSFPPLSSLESPTCSDQALSSCFPLAFTQAFCHCRPLCEGFLFPPSDWREGLSPPSDLDS